MFKVGFVSMIIRRIGVQNLNEHTVLAIIYNFKDYNVEQVFPLLEAMFMQNPEISWDQGDIFWRQFLRYNSAPLHSALIMSNRFREYARRNSTARIQAAELAETFSRIVASAISSIPTVEHAYYVLQSDCPVKKKTLLQLAIEYEDAIVLHTPEVEAVVQGMWSSPYFLLQRHNQNLSLWKKFERRYNFKNYPSRRCQILEKLEGLKVLLSVFDGVPKIIHVC